MKRFTETTKWDDPWFRQLSPKSKLLWLWLVDKCDIAGVIRADLQLASFQIGEPIDKENVEELGDRVKMMQDGKIHIPKFVPFQFGSLSEQSNVHRSVIKAIASHGLPLVNPSPTLGQGLPRGCPTPKEKEKEKEKVQAKEWGVKRGNPSLEEVKLCCAKTGLPESDAVWFWNKGEANGWTNGGQKIKSWPHTIAAWKAAGYMPSQKSSSYGNKNNGVQTSKPNPRNFGIVIGPTNYATAKPRLQRELEAKRAEAQRVAEQVASPSDHAPSASASGA